MSFRALIGLCIWPALFLFVFGVSLRLPARPLMTLTLFERPYGANLSPDAALLVTDSSDANGQTRARFWRVPTGEEIMPLRTAPQPFVEFLQDGRLVVQRRLSDSDTHRQITFWDVRTGKEWLTVQSS